MTEAEWLNCDDPQPMLEYLRGKASDRKLRLMLCGWSRLNWKWMPEQSRSAVKVAELVADGSSSDADREAADVNLCQDSLGWRSNLRNWLARLTLVGKMDLWAAANESASTNPKVQDRQQVVLKDIFGNPFRPITLDASWLTSTVTALAQAIYDERAFGRLPILADALDDAGCNQQDILSHLRGGGEHCRGCWAVDLVLGKE